MVQQQLYNLEPSQQKKPPKKKNRLKPISQKTNEGIERTSDMFSVVWLLGKEPGMEFKC